MQIIDNKLIKRIERITKWPLDKKPIPNNDVEQELEYLIKDDDVYCIIDELCTEVEYLRQELNEEQNKEENDPDEEAKWDDHRIGFY